MIKKLTQSINSVKQECENFKSDTQRNGLSVYKSCQLKHG